MKVFLDHIKETNRDIETGCIIRLEPGVYGMVTSFGNNSVQAHVLKSNNINYVEGRPCYMNRVNVRRVSCTLKIKD